MKIIQLLAAVAHLRRQVGDNHEMEEGRTHTLMIPDIDKRVDFLIIDEVMGGSVPKNQRITEVGTWEAEWPKELGWYWFYGSLHKAKPEMRFAHCVKLDESSYSTIVSDGIFLYQSSVTDWWFAKMHWPEPPDSPTLKCREVVGDE